MKINLLDVGLNERAGHHYDFDLRLVRHLVGAGHDVHVYAYEKMRDDTRADFAALCAVTPLFHYHYYSHPPDFDRFASELVSFHVQSARMAQELAAVRPADIWLCPSVEAQHVMGCALSGTTVPVVAGIHHDPGVQEKSMKAMVWRLALHTAQRNKLALTLGSIEPELRHRFMPLTLDKRFVVYPQPLDGPPRTVASPGLKRIGFFGHQRGEKGASIMRPLIARLIQDGYFVTYQSCEGDANLPPHPQIERLGFVDDFSEALAPCDLIVLPYDIQNYTVKGSGVLSQAMALGIPTIGPYGTLPGRTIEQFQIGHLFGAVTPAAIFASIKFMDRNYARFARNALRAGQVFAKQHGMARFAESMLRARA